MWPRRKLIPMRSYATFAFLGLTVAGFAIPQDSNIAVPPTSVPLQADRGIRVHTNHLIYIGPLQDLPPDENQPLWLTALHGPTLFQNASTSAYVPAQIRTAYGVPSTGGSGAIAIVDAYHFKSALNDFNVFSQRYGLPTESSANATAGTNSVFQVVYASGAQPQANGGWGQEAALDIEWAHAMAPGAKIYLVEAASSSFANMMAAVNVASGLPGVKQVSMSWGGSEVSSEYSSYDGYFTHSGVAYFASTGDSGGAVDFPAESKNVVAVGGTTLKLTTSGTRQSESAWSSGGGGVSAYEPIPSFQSNTASVKAIVGSHRGNPDISADADPYTGCWVYDSTRYQGFVGWMVFGGTSLSAPMIAGMANNAGSTATSSNAQNTKIYQNLGTTAFHDITSGSNGHAATTGWDLATGVGSPNGLSGF